MQAIDNGCVVSLARKVISYGCMGIWSSWPGKRLVVDVWCSWPGKRLVVDVWSFWPVFSILLLIFSPKGSWPREPREGKNLGWKISRHASSDSPPTASHTPSQKVCTNLDSWVHMWELWTIVNTAQIDPIRCSSSLCLLSVLVLVPVQWLLKWFIWRFVDFQFQKAVNVLSLLFTFPNS